MRKEEEYQEKLAEEEQENKRRKVALPSQVGLGRPEVHGLECEVKDFTSGTWSSRGLRPGV